MNDKERYIEQILQDSYTHWISYPIEADGPVVYQDGELTYDVGANLKRGETAHALYVRTIDDPLAILLTDKRLVSGWVCEQPLIACTMPDTEEFRYLTDAKEYRWQDVPANLDQCSDFLDLTIKETELAFAQDLGLENQKDDNQDSTDELNASLPNLPLPRLGDDALPPEDDRDADGL